MAWFNQKGGSGTDGGSARGSRRPFQWALALLIFAGAAGLAFWLVQSAPKAKPRPVDRQAAPVEVREVAFGSHRVVIDAMGVVRPANQVALQPRVRGQVISVSEALVPGGLLGKGQTILRIDPADYRLKVNQAESGVVQARAALALEQGQQAVAQREFERMGDIRDSADRALVLREPQRAGLEAALKAAESRLAQARLDLQRTTLKSPFNAVVLTRDIDIGTQVTENTTLAVLVGIDAYWIEVAVPVDQLKWIRIPTHSADTGSSAQIYDEAAWGPGVFRVGQVLRLAAGLEKQGRMARLLVEVTDPLGSGSPDEARPRLLLDAYVRAKINGAELRDVARVDRGLLREGDRVWVMDDRDRLDIREVAVVFRTAEAAIIRSGLAPGDRIVVTDLGAPVQGMALRAAAP